MPATLTGIDKNKPPTPPFYAERNGDGDDGLLGQLAVLAAQEAYAQLGIDTRQKLSQQVGRTILLRLPRSMRTSTDSDLAD